jgi:hypothetical protein
LPELWEAVRLPERSAVRLHRTKRARLRPDTLLKGAS